MARRTLVVTLVLLAATLALAHHAPPHITIDAAAKKQPPVPFDHEKHSMTLVGSCETCHHMQKGLTADKAKDTKVVRCSACHLDPKESVPSMREMSMTRNPFHIGCIGCHKEQKKGPAVCTGCHRR